MQIVALTVRDAISIVNQDESKVLKSTGIGTGYFQNVIKSNPEMDRLCYIYAEENGTYLSKLHLVYDTIPLNGKITEFYWAGALTKNEDVLAGPAPAILLMEAIDLTNRKLLIASYSKKAKPLYKIMKEERMLFPFFQRTLNCTIFYFDTSLIRRKKHIPVALRPIVKLGVSCVNVYNYTLLSLKRSICEKKYTAHFPKELSEEIVENIDKNMVRDFSSRNGEFFCMLLKSFNRHVLESSANELKANKTGFIILIRDIETNQIALLSYCLINEGIIKIKYIIGREEHDIMTVLFVRLVWLTIQKKLYGIEVSSEIERTVLRKVLVGCMEHTIIRDKESLSTIQIDESLYDFQAGIGDNIGF